ncbi:SMC5-like protein [Thozetella sp. PMI_491]|nr:SMC5-like protein [Thozetella sp. PMI_491]
MVGSANGRSARAINGKSRGEFHPGAIVAVRVKDFVTYKYAEFFPGPNLNMVIGPNGTGKSSLVCAICLGLGYHHSVLGRANNFGDYVKRGERQATVEIELQGLPKAKRNYHVRLVIDAADSKRAFYLNGKETGIRAIQGLMKDLRIQVDNLCQFLPQEKVAEFAGLGPVEYLERTMQAIAPMETIEQQKELKDLYKKHKELLRHNDDGAEQLSNLEARQHALQADVDKLREREEVQQTIKLYEDAIVLLAYDEARKAHREAKDEKKQTEKDLKRLHQSAAPSLQAVNRKREYKTRIEEAIRSRERALRATESASEALLKDVEGAEDDMRQAASKDEAERTLQVEKRKDLSAHIKKLNNLQAQYAKGSNGFDAADWNRKIREQEHEERETLTRLGELTDEMRIMMPQGKEKKEQKLALQREIEGLESQAGQLLNQLKRLKPDVAAGYMWLKDHQHEFSQEVFGPAMLSCSVKDQRYSDLVQATLRQEDFLCFTAQTKEDHIKLSDQFYKNMELSVTIRTCQTPFHTFRSPLSKAQVEELGFDGFAIDFLDGPDPVLAMLCTESRLHTSLVGLNPMTDESYAKVSQLDAVGQFVAGSQSYKTVRRREYGAAGISTSVIEVPKGRFWSDQPLDLSERQELQRKLAELSAEIKELEGVFNDKKEEKGRLDAQRKEIGDRILEIRHQKNELQKEYNIWRTLPDKIEQLERTRDQKRASIEESKERRQRLAEHKDDAVLQHVKAVLAHAKSLTAIHQASQEIVEAKVRLIEAESDLEYLKSQNVDINRRLEEAQARVQELTANMNALKEKAQEALEKAQGIVTEENQQMFQELRESKTVDDLQMEINAEKAKLDLIQAGNPHALQEYERRGAEIERLRARKEGLDAQLAELEADTAALRAEWEPQVDGLVGRINDAFAHNFEQINCAGEVSLLKDEDFEKWAIDIKVRFRENETMQRLDKQRQSGGERAVSTVFYLMALQAMAKAPFRVVDEINQGMDPRNERMVHERMVDIACNEHTSQYFLITPKLLRNLRYDPRMKVHCICSGEHMPEHDAGSETKLNLAKFVDIQRSLVAAN